jgi:NADH-quinone oxidoreductase subunit M
MAMTGSIFQAVSHGLITAALFLSFGSIIDRQGVRDFDSLGGLAKVVPVSAFFLMVFSIAAVALPLTSSFVGEFLIIIGSWKSYPVWTFVALAGVVLGSVYTLTAYLKTMFGEVRPGTQLVGRDLKGGDVVVLTALAILVVGLGIFPGRLLNTIAPAVQVQAAGTVVADNGINQGFVR